jgi:hypothetical protein
MQYTRFPCKEKFMSARIAILPCLAFAFVLGGCDSDKSAAPASEKKSMLVAAKWKLTGHTIAPAVDLEEDGVMVTDLWVTTSECLRDNVTTFHSNGTFSVDAGAIRCNDDDPQIDPGTWSLNAAEDSLSMTYDAFPMAQVHKLDGLTASSLRLSSGSTGWSDGENHTRTLVYGAQ